MLISRRLQYSLLWTLALLMLLGCARPHSRSQTLTGYAAVDIHRVALMPFLTGRPDPGKDDTLASALDCTVEAFCLVVNELPPGAEATLTRIAHGALAEKLDRRLVPLEQTLRVYSGMGKNPAVDTPRSLARRLGNLLNADHVIIGSIWRLREKTDTEGASVGFGLHLLETESGRRVWRGRYDKTQMGLTEDLRDIGDFFRRGARWLSAEEFAAHGLDQVLETFPKVRPTREKSAN